MAIDYTEELRQYIADQNGEQVLELARSAEKMGETEKALELYHLAAGMGERDALLEIAFIYTEGKGISKDEELGRSYYRMALKEENEKGKQMPSEKSE